MSPSRSPPSVSVLEAVNCRNNKQQQRSSSYEIRDAAEPTDAHEVAAFPRICFMISATWQTRLHATGSCMLFPGHWSRVPCQIKGNTAFFHPQLHFLDVLISSAALNQKQRWCSASCHRTVSEKRQHPRNHLTENKELILNILNSFLRWRCFSGTLVWNEKTLGIESDFFVRLPFGTCGCSDVIFTYATSKLRRQGGKSCTTDLQHCTELK